MIGFWVAAGLLAAAAAVLILHRAKAAASAAPEDPTLAVYRRQLAEIDDLAARGVLAETERKSAYAEAGRRLLAAADRATAAWPSATPRQALVLGVAALAPALALALYLAVGSPGLGDQPIAPRVAGWKAAIKTNPRALQPPEFVAGLRALVAEDPDNVANLGLLAWAEAEIGDPTSAARTLRRAIELAPREAYLWEALGEVLVAQAGGQVTPQAQSVFKEALRRDPAAFTARIRLAQGQIEAGERDVGLATWKGLVQEMPPTDERRAWLQGQIAQAEGAAPEAGQMAMIRGMVESLAAKLAADPDNPEGWVRLVRSYAVLGDAGERDRALREARARYRDDPKIMQALDEAAAVEAAP